MTELDSEKTNSNDLVAPKSVEVGKALQVEIDIGTLLVSDTNDVSLKQFNSNPDAYLKQVTRDNTQLLINEIWKRPFERVDDVVVTKLPKPEYAIPREKPAPKPKPLTKWQAYAKEKGIVKRKKSRLVWDEIMKKWVPRYGFRRAENDTEKDWLLEVPANADPMEDQFEKKAELKAERVSKNELQRLKNLAKAKKISLPDTGIVSKDKQSKTELHRAVHVAKEATASLGKFQPKLPKEKPLKNTGKKRKFDPVFGDSSSEKSRNLGVLDKIINKKPKFDVEKAINSKSGGSLNFKDSEDQESKKKSPFRSKTGKSKTASNNVRREGKRRQGKSKMAKPKSSFKGQGGNSKKRIGASRKRR